MLTRRWFVGGLVAAPLVVPATRLMRLRGLVMPFPPPPPPGVMRIVKPDIDVRVGDYEAFGALFPWENAVLERSLVFTGHLSELTV